MKIVLQAEFDFNLEAIEFFKKDGSADAHYSIIRFLTLQKINNNFSVENLEIHFTELDIMEVSLNLNLNAIEAFMKELRALISDMDKQFFINNVFLVDRDLKE